MRTSPSWKWVCGALICLATLGLVAYESIQPAIVKAEGVVEIREPREGDILGTNLPFGALEHHPRFEWANSTNEQARITLIYQGPNKWGHPEIYKPGDQIPLLITGSGDQNIFWNPCNNLYDGDWKIQVEAGEAKAISPIFTISSRG